MLQFKKLAIAGAVAASLLGATAAQAHVSYHVTAPLGTEAPNGNGTGNNADWTDGAPVGYVGNLPATWLANIHDYDNTYLVSAADAISKSSVTHPVSSAFVLQSANNKWKVGPGNTSWGNALDYGLINMEVAGNLTITVEADASLSSTFAPGFTLWNGWGDAGTGNKHQAWHFTAGAPNTLGVTGISFVGEAGTTTDGGSVSYTFNNLVAGNYSLWIGGNGSNNSNEYYKASLSVAAVPVPGAVWLFGTAVVGMIGVGRRKTVISA